MHRIAFPATGAPTLVVDLGHTIGSNKVILGAAAWDGVLLRLESKLDGSYSTRAEFDRPEGMWTIDAPSPSDETPVNAETLVSEMTIAGSFAHAQWPNAGKIAFTMRR